MTNYSRLPGAPDHEGASRPQGRDQHKGPGALQRAGGGVKTRGGQVKNQAVQHTATNAVSRRDAELQEAEAPRPAQPQGEEGYERGSQGSQAMNKARVGGLPLLQLAVHVLVMHAFRKQRRVRALEVNIKLRGARRPDAVRLAEATRIPYNSSSVRNTPNGSASPAPTAEALRLTRHQEHEKRTASNSTSDV